MRERIIILSIFAFVAACVFAKDACKPDGKLSVRQIMAKIAAKGEKLEAFTSNITYSLTEDPDIFETTTIHTGCFKYLKSQERQYVMLDFVERQQDDFPPEDYHQRYIFDGVWLTRIDYPLKQINRDRIAPDDEPEEVFKLLSEDFPLIGFSGIDRLSVGYDITLEQSPKDELYALQLKAVEDADVKYYDVLFLIDKKDFLPRLIKAASVSDNSISKIELRDVVVNPKIDKKVFDVETPEGFTVSEREDR